MAGLGTMFELHRFVSEGRKLIVINRKSVIAISLLGLAISLGNVTAAQAQRGFPQPAPPREVTVTEIPGVIAAGAQWKLVWGGTDNADGIVGTSDGGVLFAQEQPSRVSKIDKNDKVSVYLENTHGTGALTIDHKGHILGVARTCTDPGGHPDECHEATAVVYLTPKYKVIADNVDGKSLGRLNDLVIDKKGDIYFNGGGTFFLSRTGKVTSIGENIRTNGIILSTDEKTLYFTNGNTLVAFDIQPDGSVTNQRTFAKLEAGGNGDGSEIDSEGRLYISSGPGVQVFSPDGKYLGLIPTPRPIISITFSGSGRKTMYVVGAGATGPDGQEDKTAPGVRNDAKSIYKIQMIAQGFRGRAK